MKGNASVWPRCSGTTGCRGWCPQRAGHGQGWFLLVTHGDVRYWCFMIVEDRWLNAGIELSDRLGVYIVYRSIPVWFGVLCTQVPNCEAFICYRRGILLYTAYTYKYSYHGIPSQSQPGLVGSREAAEDVVSKTIFAEILGAGGFVPHSSPKMLIKQPKWIKMAALRTHCWVFPKSMLSCYLTCILLWSMMYDI